jgi:type II secretory pathway pseudopilin PulG
MRKRIAFTIVELLIVISIIALLAALIFPAARAAIATRTKHRARAELRQIETFIDLYKIDLNFYPPTVSSSGNSANSLYYELAGTRLNQGMYVTLDGVSQISAQDVTIAFGLSGFANSMTGSDSDDLQRRVQNYFKGGLRLGQYAQVSLSNVVLKGSAQPVVLGSQIQGPGYLSGPGGVINPYGYNSANPTYNPNSYDIWLDILVNGAPIRISNWSDRPSKL